MIVYTKEYIANNKVMQRCVHHDGVIEIKYIREIEFKDTKKYPHLKLEKPEEKKPDKVEEKIIEKPLTEHILNIAKIIEPKEENEDKSKNRRYNKKPEIKLPKPEELETE